MRGLFHDIHVGKFGLQFLEFWNGQHSVPLVGFAPGEYMKKLTFAILVCVTAAIALAGEDVIGSVSTTGRMADGGINVGAVSVPQGSLFSIQITGPDVENDTRGGFVQIVSVPDAGLYDAGGAWYQAGKQLLKTSARAGQTGVLFMPAAYDGGTMTMKIFSLVGNE